MITGFVEVLECGGLTELAVLEEKGTVNTLMANYEISGARQRHEEKRQQRAVWQGLTNGLQQEAAHV